jgi:hypothetical protein
MPHIDPVSAAATYFACVIILGLGAVWLGSFWATRFDDWLRRRRRRRMIERCIDDMSSGAPEGGRRHRPF